MALQAIGMFPAFSPLNHSPLAQSQVRMIIMFMRFMMMMIT